MWVVLGEGSILVVVVAPDCKPDNVPDDVQHEGDCYKHRLLRGRGTLYVSDAVWIDHHTLGSHRCQPVEDDHEDVEKELQEG